VSKNEEKRNLLGPLSEITGRTWLFGKIMTDEEIWFFQEKCECQIWWQNTDFLISKELSIMNVFLQKVNQAFYFFDTQILHHKTASTHTEVFNQKTNISLWKPSVHP
jgi:hypothetical protein